MLRLVLPCAVAVLAVAGSAAAQTPSPTGAAAATEATPVDPVTVTGERNAETQIVCEERVVTGSRRTRKVCSTVANIQGERQAAQEFLTDSGFRGGRVKGENGGVVATASNRSLTPMPASRARPRPTKRN